MSKLVNIPKVDPDGIYDIYIYRTGIIESKKALLVRCRKQIIEGVTIPSGYELWIPNLSILAVQHGFSSNPYVHVTGWKLNQVLRTLYIDQLRNGKR